MLNWIKLAVVVFVIGAAATFHYNAIKQVHQEYSLAAKEQERKAKEAEGEIALKASQLEQEKNEEITRLNVYAASLLSSLSKRPTRPDQGTLVTRVESSCTGKELYQEDGEFLVREAARAEQILVERNFYYEQYEQTRKRINEFNNSH